MLSIDSQCIIKFDILLSILGLRFFLLFGFQYIRMGIPCTSCALTSICAITPARAYMHTSTRRRSHISTSTHNCTHTDINTPAPTHTRTHIHTNTHTHTHTLAYAHTNICKTWNKFIIMRITLAKISENNSHWVSRLHSMQSF